MAKIVKKKRRLKIEAMVSLFFVLSLFMYLGSALFLKSYNVILSADLNNKESELAKKNDEMESLRLAVKELEDRDRILAVANESGIVANQNNVVIVNED